MSNIEKVSEEDKVKEEQADEFVVEDIPPYVLKNQGIVSDTQKKKRKKIIWSVAIAALVLIILAVIYASGVVKRKNVFEKNTTINGVDVSGKTLDEARVLIYEAGNTYSLEIKFKNGTHTLKINDADLDIVFDGDIKEFFDRQNPYKWPLNIGKIYSYELNYHIQYTEDRIKKFIDEFPEMDEDNMIPSKDAIVTMKDGEAQIIADEEGTELDKEKVYQLILDALSNEASSVDIADGNCYVPAEFDADSSYIQNSLENAEKFLALNCYYMKQSSPAAKISKEELCEMGSVDDEGNIVVNREAVAAYIASLAKLYPEQVQTSQTISFLNHRGVKKSISTRKMDWVFDIDTEIAELYNNLSSMTDFTRAPVFKSLENEQDTEVSVGDTYLEIDLGEQRVYFYRNRHVVYSTLCVSGCESLGMSTPAGYYVMGKPETNARLVGEGNAYDTRVAYWMPFINQEIGLHDASWKTEFGGDIYKYNGSHGCINLSTDAAKTLFSMVYEGLPVIVYN